MNKMLTIPHAGWMNIHLKDDKNEVNIPVSYICDPVWDLLDLFRFLLMKKLDNTYCPISSLCFDAESIDSYLTFTDYMTMVTIITDEPHTTIIYKDWEEILDRFLEELQDENYLNDYCLDWYDDEDREENKKVLLETIEGIKELKEKYKSRKKIYEEF